MRNLNNLQIELKKRENERKYLWEKYSRIKKGRFIPIPNDIIDKLEYLRVRIENLKVNINQLKMRAMNT
jgi:hypothetical protein